MKHMKISIFIFISTLASSLFSQTSINTIGTSEKSSAGSVSFSIGQTVFNFSNGINEGVQQPIELFQLNSEKNNHNNNVTVYPNPTSQKIFVNLDIPLIGSECYTIISADGKLVLSGKLVKENEINISSLPSEIYIFSIIQNKNSIQSYKLIKK